MIDALGTPQRILLLGGSSEIGLAVVRGLLPRDRTADVVLAGRDEVALSRVAKEFPADQVRVRMLAFDAADIASHRDVAATAWEDGDVDIVVFAFGVLGDQATLIEDPEAAAALITVNQTGAVSMGLHVALRMRAQGHGHIIALSSIAAERARPANFIYGASKAGFDAFFDGLGYHLSPHGVTVSIVRPGFVRTRMTADLEVPPLASMPSDISDAAVRALGRTGARYPTIAHRALGFALRLAPRSVVRRLP